jgi:tetratricopeptide (TPR) repeat protein
MFKRIVLIPVIVGTLCVLVSPPLVAQTKSDADKLFQEGLQLFEKARSNEDMQKAAQKCEEALGIFRTLGSRKAEGNALMTLGDIYGDLGQRPKAEAYYQKSLAICRELSDIEGEAYILGHLGSIYADVGQYPKATDFFEKSLEIAKELGVGK